MIFATKTEQRFSVWVHKREERCKRAETWTQTSSSWVLLQWFALKDYSVFVSLAFSFSLLEEKKIIFKRLFSEIGNNNTGESENTVQYQNI